MRRTPPATDPTRTALIVVDMQHGFLDPAGIMFVREAQPIVRPVASLVTFCRAAGMIIVWTRMSHEGVVGGAYRDLFPQHFLPNGQPKLRHGTPDFEILPDLGFQAGDVVVDKVTYSGFAGTKLEGILRAAGRDTVVVCGIATNVCCESTARDAFSLGFRVIVISDATATGSAEAHLASLRTLGLAFGWVISIAELKETVEANHTGRRR